MVNENNIIVSKKSLISFCSFIVSPIFSFIVVLFNIINRNKTSITLVSFIVGTISFAYVPFSSDDRTRHYERFFEISNLNSITDFVEYLNINSSVDFVVYYLMYLLSSVTSDPRWLFFICTTFTFYSFTYVYFKIENLFSLNRKWFVISFLLVLFSFPYIASFSGLRFSFATGFIVFGAYNLIILKNKLLSVLFFLLAIFSHFATLPVVLVCFTVYYFPKLNYRLLFYISLFFAFISAKQLLGIIALTPIGDSIYFFKVNDYLGSFDLLTHASENASTLKMILIFKKLWVYLLALYLFFNKGMNKRIEIMVLSILIFRNLFSGVPTVLSYYDCIALFMCAILLIDGIIKNKRKFIYPLIVFFALNFMMEIYKNRIIFIATNFQVENALSVSLFLKETPKPIKPQWK